MAKGFNKVILMGNLTRDPEVTTTSGGQNVAKFGLAVNRTWRSADGSQQESVSFIDCVAWGKAGDIIAQYLQKGRPLLVSGHLEQSSWEKDGQKRSKVEVIVEDFNFVDSRSGSSDNGPASSGADSANQASKAPAKKNNKDVVIEDIGDEPINLDDIPF